MKSVRNGTSLVARISVITLSLILIGCGEKVSPGRGVPVSGTVTLDGKPIEGASVTFMNDTFVGFGKTDASGKYRLVQGALPGTNKVTISKIEGGAEIVENPDEGMDRGQMEAMAMGNTGKTPTLPKDLIPAEYSDPRQTKLTYEVPATGGDGADFNL
jgi:hypothetical protein